jgi:segregation and condensation protein A
MSLGITAHQAPDYTVITPVFTGPLDLLLQLIERAELDITRLALAQVTDQYLAHIRLLEDLAAEEVSAFLVIASRLIQIKSEALLPRPPVREPGEEDPGEALAQQLRLYKRYKEIANLLESRDAARLHTYLRLAPSPRLDSRFDLSEITLADLVEAARAAMAALENKSELGAVVAAPRVTIREKVKAIVSSLRQSRQIAFSTLLSSARTRLEVVVTFLALLELVKQHMVQIRQDSLFGEIQLQASESFDNLSGDEADIELEFGE